VRSGFLIAWWYLSTLFVIGAEKMPPKPDGYFNDYAHVVSPATAQRLDQELRDFERETSNQILVAVYPKMESDSSIQDFTFRSAESWKVGQKGKDNGAVLFVFTEPRTLWIQVGYGLEGALPDITAKQIIENDIKPAFRARNYDAGFTAGVHAMMKATRGEYRGAGKTRGSQSQGGFVPLIFIALFFLIFIVRIFAGGRRAVVYGRNGRSFAGGVATDVLLSVLSSSGRYRGGGGGSGGFFGGGGGGDGGGFSGGGGSFGGGGAGGDW